MAAVFNARSIWPHLFAGGCSFLLAAELLGVEFVPLGFLAEGFTESLAHGVSGDGRVVVGESGRRAFRWTAEEGMVGLGPLPGGGVESRANAASFDGSIIVGRASTGDGGYAAFRWTKEEGMAALPNPGERITEAIDVSADGRVILVSDGDALLWTENEGLSRLPDPSECCWDAVQPMAISADGSVVVGDAYVTSSFSPYRWVKGLGADIFVRTNQALLVRDTSAGGSTIVGIIGFNPEESEAFRWTESEGLLAMPPPPADISDSTVSAALAVSADGRIITGSIGRHDTNEYWENIYAAVWDEVRGWRRIDEILIHGGVDLMGWHLSSAREISADGRVLVGRGINPDGKTEAWVAVIPEPATIVLCWPFFVMGICILRQKRRARSRFSSRSHDGDCARCSMFQRDDVAIAHEFTARGRLRRQSMQSQRDA